MISDASTEGRMAGLECFLERYLGPRQAEFGTPEEELRRISMPGPLRRLFRFAGRWPGHNPRSPYENRFCIQDHLSCVHPKEWAVGFKVMDGKLVFVWENQTVWVAATEGAGKDPPVWISEKSSHRNEVKIWRQLEQPLSHFLVSFVLQELMFGSEIVAVAPKALEKFQDAGMEIEPVWMRGEYAWGIDRPSYYLAGDRFLVRRALGEADGDDWYGGKDAAGEDVLKSLGLPTKIG